METIKVAENGFYTNGNGKRVELKKDLDYAVEHSEHYDDDFDYTEALKKLDEVKEKEESQFNSLLKRQPLQCFRRTDFLVVSASWLEAASELLNASTDTPFPGSTTSDQTAPSSSSSSSPNSKNKSYIRVGVLNSASGTTPGGRFLKGTVSQEDCLCRASLLYSCISQPKFQSEGRFYGKNRLRRYGTSNCVIFSPGECCVILSSVQ